MKCPKCQFDNPDATNFCGKCGMPLTADARMAAISQKVYFGPWMIAYPYAAAGDKEETLEWLERGYEVGDPGMPYLGQPHSILKDLLGDHPRFQDLLRRMNLPTGDER